MIQYPQIHHMIDAAAALGEVLGNVADGYGIQHSVIKLGGDFGSAGVVPNIRKQAAVRINGKGRPELRTDVNGDTFFCDEMILIKGGFQAVLQLVCEYVINTLFIGFFYEDVYVTGEAHPWLGI